MDFEQPQLTRAAVGQGDFPIIACNDHVVALASTNLSQFDFQHGRSRPRFKAWKKSRLAYWLMGAEVETWGHDFTTARIERRYLDTAFGQTCTLVKQGSDEDRNDDYVDEDA